MLISRQDIEKRVSELGRQITRDYFGKHPILIGVLNGSFIFIADLVRAIELDLEIDFIKIASYGNNKVSSGEVQLHKDINAEIRNRHVLVVEDIVDTGLSIHFLQKRFNEMDPVSYTHLTLPTN